MPGAIVYLQYGPSQPEFLELGGSATEGFCWSTVLGVYGDKIGQDFRAKYLKRFPKFVGNMGLVYTGNGYDIVQYLKRSWEATKKPEDFEANCKWIRENPYRGVCGMMNMNNEFQEALHFPGQRLRQSGGRAGKGNEPALRAGAGRSSQDHLAERNCRIEASPSPLVVSRRLGGHVGDAVLFLRGSLAGSWVGAKC